MLNEPPRPAYAHGARTRDLSQAILVTLLERGMRAGDRLPTEHEMAAQFQVSRPTVRQALKVLEFSGLIASAPRRGTVLKAADSRALGSLFAAHVALSEPESQGDLAALAEARWLLERSLAPLVVSRHTRADIDALIQTETNYEAGIEAADDHAVLAADAAFHRAYVASAHNPVVSALRAVIDGYFDAVGAQRPQKPLNTAKWRADELRTIAEHRQMRQAIEQRDVEGLQKMLDKHLQRTIALAKKLQFKMATRRTS
ncbi:MAG TPA: FCD domain-containing protein [Planctomycetota bacterium]|nr:FCD domain-containing protein [Planctomycetota bacterium]